MHPVPPFDPPSTSLTGLTLGGRYSIEQRVGAGGMAHVYLARDLEGGRDVAIKLLLPQLVSDP
jgi:serine/threonine-protein kinase